LTCYEHEKSPGQKNEGLHENKMAKENVGRGTGAVTLQNIVKCIKFQREADGQRISGRYEH
jgi:hypothetical protein